MDERPGHVHAGEGGGGIATGQQVVAYALLVVIATIGDGISRL